jgi:hypothetical protein
MAVRLKTLGLNIIAAAAAMLVVAGLITGPALAAPERALFCADDDTPTLDNAADALLATPVNTSDELLENHVLRPGAQSAARGAFGDEPSPAEPVEQSKAMKAEGAAATEPGLHSASERKGSPYKRQMYRRDI